MSLSRAISASSSQFRWCWVIMHDATLIMWGCAETLALSPLHAEAQALLMVMRKVIHLNYSICAFLTDSQEMEWLLNTKHPPVPSQWQAHREVIQCWRLMNEYTHFQCRHIRREKNTQAHQLANQGRCARISHENCTVPIFLPTM